MVFLKKNHTCDAEVASGGFSLKTHTCDAEVASRGFSQKTHTCDAEVASRGQRCHVQGSLWALDDVICVPSTC